MLYVSFTSCSIKQFIAGPFNNAIIGIILEYFVSHNIAVTNYCFYINKVFYLLPIYSVGRCSHFRLCIRIVISENYLCGLFLYLIYNTTITEFGAIKACLYPLKQYLVVNLILKELLLIRF